MLCGFTDAVVKENYEFKDTLKAFDDFKNKQEKCMKYCFSICKGWYIYSESLFNHKNALFYLSRALTHQFYF